MQELKLADDDVDPEAAQDWGCMEWGAVGGPAAREAALWVQLQREFRNRNLLPLQAIRRLDALDFPWEPQVTLPSQFTCHAFSTCLKQPMQAQHLAGRAILMLHVRR